MHHSTQNVLFKLMMSWSNDESFEWLRVSLRKEVEMRSMVDEGADPDLFEKTTIAENDECMRSCLIISVNDQSNDDDGRHSVHEACSRWSSRGSEKIAYIYSIYICFLLPLPLDHLFSIFRAPEGGPRSYTRHTIHWWFDTLDRLPAGTQSVLTA